MRFPAVPIDGSPTAAKDEYAVHVLALLWPWPTGGDGDDGIDGPLATALRGVPRAAAALWDFYRAWWARFAATDARGARWRAAVLANLELERSTQQADADAAVVRRLQLATGVRRRRRRRQRRRRRRGARRGRRRRRRRRRGAVDAG